MSYLTAPTDQPRRTRNIIWIIGVLACYAAFCYVARTWVYSLSGWIVLGLAPALLLDKVVFQILSPPETEPRLTQIGIRFGYFALGMAGFYLLIDGTIAPIEALFLGAVLSLVTFLFEFGLEWSYYLASWLRPDRAPEKPSPMRLTLMAALIAFPLVMLHPLMTVHPVRRVPAETPFELGLLFDEFEFKTEDGVQLTGWFVPAERPRATVIYCHGYGENRGQSLSLLKPLNSMGVNVLAFDFRGHGTSDGHTVTFGYRERHDLLAAYHQAKRRAPRFAAVHRRCILRRRGELAEPGGIARYSRRLGRFHIRALGLHPGTRVWLYPRAAAAGHDFAIGHNVMVGLRVFRA